MHNGHQLRNILVIRFRQMGDTIVATPMLDTLRRNWPEAHIDLVLNDRIAPLFEDHPSIDHIITFTNDERHNALRYIRKVWRVVHHCHYDVIIDMRSTMNTMLFALFSPSTRYRIGLRKSYTRLVFNHFVAVCNRDQNMVDHNLELLEPLHPTELCHRLSLSVTDQEIASFRAYMEHEGIDFSRPIILCGVTAKLASKVWAEDRMVEVIRRLMDSYPDAQFIFNYAPGQEEQNARRMWAALGSSPRIKIDLQAHSPRELVAMASMVTMYFGNEGGARHIVHSQGKPSFVICAPASSKKMWIPQDGIPADGIQGADVARTEGMTPQQVYDVITVDEVWRRLLAFINANHIMDYQKH